MAAYISVPRDLTKVKSKVAFNLTKRQLLCFGTAALIGVPLFFVLRDSGGNTAATLGMMAVMLPAFFLGMYEKNGQPLEKLLSYYVQSRFVRPKIRPYKTNNYYALLMKGGMTHQGEYSRERLILRLRTVHPKTITRLAQNDTGNVADRHMKQILSIYNGAGRAHSLPCKR